MKWIVGWAARLPWGIIYRASALLAGLMYRFGYRRSVIEANLGRAFPHLDARHRARLIRAFYRHLADVILETVKVADLSESELRRRVVVRPSPAYDRLLLRGGVVITAHLGNWEWAGLRVGLDLSFPHYVVYLPLKNPTADRLMHRLRSRFGNVPVPVKRITRRLLRHRGAPFVASFLADQNPPPPDVQAWYGFFGRPVPVHMGPERLARRLNVPVFWAYAVRVARGRYEIRFEMMAERPAALPPGEVMHRYMHRLEAAVRAHPDQWLWSHRRWKLTPPSSSLSSGAGEGGRLGGLESRVER